MARPFASLAAGTPIPSTVEDLRVRALSALYSRRDAVDRLIHSLEEYRDLRTAGGPPDDEALRRLRIGPKVSSGPAGESRCIPFSIGRKCS